ncbi:MAG TPA: sigma-E factor negative regulatory protein [Steroidobacteraceae bacterium]|nr:sigma-E factor negative regulatory protein [Steroidobacteraceae bacterium]
MNEELDSQLSAMFDDELPEAECLLLARRLSRDDGLKARWRRYAVIGASVRAERGVRLDTDLSVRVSAAISAEPVLAGASVAEGRGRRGGSIRWWQPVVGGAIAAGVAAMSVLWIRSQAPVGDEALVAQNAAPTTLSAQTLARSSGGGAPGALDGGGKPDSYVVPTNVEPRSVVPMAELANYVVAHSEFSAPLTRRNLLSALVASESGTQGGANESDSAVEDTGEHVEDVHVETAKHVDTAKTRKK